MILHLSQLNKSSGTVNHLTITIVYPLPVQNLFSVVPLPLHLGKWLVDIHGGNFDHVKGIFLPNQNLRPVSPNSDRMGIVQQGNNFET